MTFDLEERTVTFGKRIVNLCRNVKATRLSEPMTIQLLRSATSVGANYFEANGASSKKDFKNKIHICKKEIKETTYWLQVLDDFCETKNELAELQQEAHELLLIFSKIAASSK